MDVKIFNDQCHMDAEYHAEQVYINAKDAYIDIYLPNNTRIHVPFAWVKEVQVQYEGFFRSYAYEGGEVIERKTAVCTGSI